MFIGVGALWDDPNVVTIGLVSSSPMMKRSLMTWLIILIIILNTIISSKRINLVKNKTLLMTIGQGDPPTRSVKVSFKKKNIYPCDLYFILDDVYYLFEETSGEFYFYVLTNLIYQ